MDPDIYRHTYLDNGGTTSLSPAVQRCMRFYQRWGNPSAHYSIVDDLLEYNKRRILGCVGLPPGYTIIYTSGGSESNCLFLRGLVDHHLLQSGEKPHIISSEIEHKSTLECLGDLERLGRAEVSYLNPGSEGRIDPQEVEKLIRPNTIALSFYHVHNELGSINDLPALHKVARERNIAFHIDAVQSFAKIPFPAVDAISVSFHKLHGPGGIGALICRAGLPILPQINGAQNGGMRGGTLNLPAIMGAGLATQLISSHRREKLCKALHLNRILREELASLGLSTLDDPRPGTIIFLGPRNPIVRSPYTILFSWVGVCKLKVQKYLLDNGIIVSTGSACSAGHSSIPEKIGIPPLVRKGIIRVSISDDTSPSDIIKLTECIKSAPKTSIA